MAPKVHHILTPEPESGLVRREAATALARAGHSLYPVPEDAAATIARLLTLPPERTGLPAWPSLYFCINFAGLDKYGETAALLRAKGVPVAVWCVDNPWNLLAGFRTEFWKDFFLFVTDPSFVPQLAAHGARHVAFLPLAADVALMEAVHTGTAPQAMRPVVFVGRSRFPDKERFFVGQEASPAILAEALALMENGVRPDFAWWLNAFDLCPQDSLWPDGAVRGASLGAETCSLRWRQRSLEGALPAGLTIFGDADWGTMLAGTTADIRPPVDYYATLPAVYRAAECSLNMTSLLLPHGLNQRHFDVWAADGFCLLDATPGLDLFPAALTAPVTFASPTEIPALVASFRNNPDEKRHLTKVWKKHILAEHTYDARASQLIKTVFP